MNLALEIQHEGRAGVFEQVGNDGADALAGAGRGAGQHMAVLAEPAIGPARRSAQDTQHEGIFGRSRCQMARRVARGAKMGGPMSMKRRRGEQGCPQAPDRTRNQRATRHQDDNDRQTPERKNQAVGWKAGQLAHTGEDHPGERDPQDNPEDLFQGSLQAEPVRRAPEADGGEHQYDPADNDVGMINRRGLATGGLGGQAAGGNERGGQSRTRSHHAASVAGPSDNGAGVTRRAVPP